MADVDDSFRVLALFVWGLLWAWRVGYPLLVAVGLVWAWRGRWPGMAALLGAGLVPLHLMALQDVNLLRLRRLELDEVIHLTPFETVWMVAVLVPVFVTALGASRALRAWWPGGLVMAISLGAVLSWVAPRHGWQRYGPIVELIPGHRCARFADGSRWCVLAGGESRGTPPNVMAIGDGEPAGQAGCFLDELRQGRCSPLEHLVTVEGAHVVMQHHRRHPNGQLVSSEGTGSWGCGACGSDRALFCHRAASFDVCDTLRLGRGTGEVPPGPLRWSGLRTVAMSSRATATGAHVVCGLDATGTARCGLVDSAGAVVTSFGERPDAAAIVDARDGVCSVHAERVDCVDDEGRWTTRAFPTAKALVVTSHATCALFEASPARCEGIHGFEVLLAMQ